MAQTYIEHQERTFSLDIQKYTEELKRLGANNMEKLREKKREIIEGTKF